KNYDPYIDEWLTDTRYFSYRVCGDTIIEDCTYAKIRCEDFHSSSTWFFIALETDGIIYSYSEQFGAIIPLMDFNTHINDIFSDYLKVTDISSMIIENVERKVITLENGLCYWIAGIGATRDYYITDYERPIGYVNELQACYLNGECMFSIQNFENMMAGLEKTLSDSVHPETIYDMMGRPVSEARPGQLYIRDGRLVRW
ncbi:MAG: hypothetical protein NC336_03455, partial [Clostridium sp.]|nr:hypothetical protein [Clostridium sp.]